mmetsp:Transcript_24400/g.39303  ORF Transcript_24400/g.39303 Transcript_24400/m.39303 type:complete len:224 (+) Transcript_24400:634-1305(+)
MFFSKIVCTSCICASVNTLLLELLLSFGGACCCCSDDGGGFHKSWVQPHLGQNLYAISLTLLHLGHTHSVNFASCSSSCTLASLSACCCASLFCKGAPSLLSSIGGGGCALSTSGLSVAGSIHSKFCNDCTFSTLTISQSRSLSCSLSSSLCCACGCGCGCGCCCCVGATSSSFSGWSSLLLKFKRTTLAANAVGLSVICVTVNANVCCAPYTLTVSPTCKQL